MPSYKLAATGDQLYHLAKLVLASIQDCSTSRWIARVILHELTLYDSAGAAEYLGISPFTLSYHLWQQPDLARRLVPDLRVGQGKVFLFTRMTLDDWNSTRRKPGRPARSPK